MRKRTQMQTARAMENLFAAQRCRRYRRGARRRRGAGRSGYGAGAEEQRRSGTKGPAQGSRRQATGMKGRRTQVAIGRNE